MKKEYQNFLTTCKSQSNQDFEDFISSFESFCANKGISELEISQLKQRHLARLNPEKVERVFNNWEDIVLFILQSGLVSLLTLDSAKNNDFLSKEGKENFRSKLESEFTKDIESTLRNIFYTFISSFVSYNLYKNKCSDEMYFYSAIASIFLFILLNDQIMDRISAIKQTENQKDKMFEDLAGIVKETVKNNQNNDK